ncbi:MAG: PDZ domain-containing protein [Gemmatimonadaceae bacterium]
MSIAHVLVSTLVVAAMVTPVEAQQSRPRDTDRSARVFSFTSADDDRPRIGVATGPGGKRDTLGLLVTDVTRGGPAEKAGIEEGDRLQSVNGVSLRVAAADIDDMEFTGIGTRRLVRELGKLEPGAEVELRVYREGQTRVVKVRTVAAADLAPERTTVSTLRREADERATIGIGLGTSGSKRDTMGILIASVTDDGPADKARIEEGDRIAAINGVDLRVGGEDAGDWSVSSSRLRRLTREMEKLKPGDEVELRLTRAGQTRTVRVKTVAAKDLPGGSRSMYVGDGAIGIGGPGWFSFGPKQGGAVRLLPKLQLQHDGQSMLYLDRFDTGDLRMRLPPERRADLEARMGDAMKRLRDVQVKVRPRIQFEDQ